MFSLRSSYLPWPPAFSGSSAADEVASSRPAALERATWGSSCMEQHRHAPSFATFTAGEEHSFYDRVVGGLGFRRQSHDSGDMASSSSIASSSYSYATSTPAEEGAAGAAPAAFPVGAGEVSSTAQQLQKQREGLLLQPQMPYGAATAAAASRRKGNPKEEEAMLFFLFIEG